MLPTWSDRAKKSVSLFFRKWNDIDIYVEDKSFSTLKVYNEILNRISNGKYRIERVFPLGPKHKVVEACRNHDPSRGREALYIIDGDLDLLIGGKIAEDDRLYIQTRYCLENFLIDENAMAEIIYEEDPEITKEDALTKICFTEYKNEVNCLMDLFVVFATMRKFLPGVKSVGNGLSGFISGGKTPALDPEKVHCYISEMRNVMCEIYGAEAIIGEESAISERATADNRALVYVSGKDFLLPAFIMHVRKKHKIHSTNEAIKVRLAKHCKTSPFKALSIAMEKRSKYTQKQ